MFGPDYVHGVGSDEEYRQKQLEAIENNIRRYPARYKNTVEHVVLTLRIVRVNHGRLLTDCDCGNGLSVSREWNVARCFSCGAVYHALVFPGNLDAIAAELNVRPVTNRNWDVGEDIVTLRLENIANKVAAPDDLVHISANAETVG